MEHEYSCLIYVCTCDNAELERLKAENEKLHTDSLQNYRESLEAYQAYVKSLRAENARLREALEFYADGEDVVIQRTDSNFIKIDREIELISNDFDVSVKDGFWKKGKRAREALKGNENE